MNRWSYRNRRESPEPQSCHKRFVKSIWTKCKRYPTQYMKLSSQPYCNKSKRKSAKNYSSWTSNKNNNYSRILTSTPLTRTSLSTTSTLLSRTSSKLNKREPISSSNLRKSMSNSCRKARYNSSGKSTSSKRDRR